MNAAQIAEARTAKRLAELLQKRKAKGNKSWKPAILLDVPNKRAGFRYRWRLRETDNIQKALQEGWEFENRPSGHVAPAVDPAVDIVDETGRLKTSLTEFRELVLMRLPEEIAVERDEYYEIQTEAQNITPDKFRQYAADQFIGADLDASALYTPTVIE